MSKKLVRSKDAVIGGVCGGLANYFGIDKTMMRVIYAVLTLLTAFCGVLVYIILFLVMPKG